ncbi:MAG: hypothetical protein A3H59_01375 [Candidatus Jacksonbacteria bacterium RIFCSPLOWO2_02_FULL_43_9]|nr:MAG: hypothetical protein A3B94_00915 [Candidatus Jacksonbacteria bacterium RIFCSPHIGHO2_02_FULL_43_10]OGY70816.1 MAG: hypothetical protein A2986_00510 [Candidatus Jacksonbacteria bacterium RIFCSPLOWO2_01_FULL_44_13]OGY73558.1 MAG: hypothetical protein A3H59_01375 [Candidatus Jacksonbacteria bacterium RIFCSPLOWO2_02_FULL_43_9]HAZ17103.1 hypothetical protein [Candidatus Jacksonbacteria bacterium]
MKWLIVFGVLIAIAGVVCASTSATLTWGQIKRGVTIIPQRIAPRVWAVVRVDPDTEILPLIRQEVGEEGKTVYALLSELETHGVELIFEPTALGDMLVGFAGEVEFDTRVEQPARYLLVYVRKGAGEYRAWDGLLDEPVPVGEIVWVAVLVGVQYFDPTIRLDGIKWEEL